MKKLVGVYGAIWRSNSNPLLRLPITFVEVFPVGVLISLVSGFVLSDSKKLAAE